MPRFLAWALVLVAVAVGSALAGLDWWLIVLVELAAWALVTVADRLVDHRPRKRPVAVAAPVEPLPPPEPEPQELPQPEPEPEPVASTPAPDEGRRRLIRPPRPAAPKPSAPPVRWNIWSLERVARDHPEAEELEYLVASLRQFADAAGQLPADFDPLVRESFGDLLVG
jgi:hypothetical protein